MSFFIVFSQSILSWTVCGFRQEHAGVIEWSQECDEMIIKKDCLYWPKGENRMLHIYLPDDYEAGTERYPVMYMFDGHNLFYDSDATYGTSWGLQDFMRLYDKQMIIVGMECSHRGNERLEEYCPYHRKMLGLEISGTGDLTMQWIRDTVKPMIDSEFRTYGHREATAIGGSSMGGLMTLYAVLAYNDIFSKNAALSTGLFWNISGLRKELADHQINSDTRIYMSWGEKEMGRAARGGNPATETREARSVYKFERELQKRGVRTYHYFQWGGEHCERDWRAQNGIYMDFLWK